MADKIVVVPQHSLKPLKVVKWKVNEGNSISIGCVLLLYKIDGDNNKETIKLKSTKAGTVYRIVAQEGDVVKFGDTLLELKACIHPTVMKDMCAECGADLRKDDLEMTASVPMIHSVPELKVSVELAQKLGKADSDRLLKDRKLVLLVDLDQTLIHTTNDNIPPNIRDVYHFQLYGAHSPWYHTRLRPGTHRFLSNMSSLYELHICTFGARNYAHTIAMFLDQDGKLFSQRILSRDECFNSNSKTANLKALFPCGDNMVCIIDDREDVWSYASNLIHVKPYHFFQHTGDINAPPGLDKHEDDEKEGIDLTKVQAESKTKINGSPEPVDNKEELPEDSLSNENIKQNEVEEKDTNEKSSTTNKEKVLLEEDVKQNDEIKNTNTEHNIDSNKDEEKKNTTDSEETQKNDTTVTQGETNNGEVKEDKSKEKEQSDMETDVDKAESDKKPQPEIEESRCAEKQEEFIEIEDPDDYLLHLEEILTLIHRAFYDKYDIMESGDVPDLKKVIPEVRSSVLKGTKLVFSGLVPTHIKLEQSKAYQVARSLGAIVTQDIEDDSTHLVAVRPGTAKVNAGRRKKNLKIVTPDWLWACAERWERVDEKLFPLNNKGSKNRHPPPHCSSPEHIPNFEVTETRKRTPSGRFMDTINPLMSFSSADIADMDREVEDIFNESESESEANKKLTDPDLNKPRPLNDSDDESSSSDESLTGEHPHGWNPEKSKSRKRSRDDQDQEIEDESTADEFPSTKFRRGEELSSDLEFGQDSNSEGSVDAPDEMDDGDWNMMGAALEREFLANN